MGGEKGKRQRPCRLFKECSKCKADVFNSSTSLYLLYLLPPQKRQNGRTAYSAKHRKEMKKRYSRGRGGNYSGAGGAGRKRRKGREATPRGPDGNPKGPHLEAHSARMTGPSGPFHKAGKPARGGLRGGKRKRGSEYTLPPAVQR